MAKIYLICNTGSSEPIENKYLKTFPDCILCDELLSSFLRGEKEGNQNGLCEFTDIRFCFILSNAIDYKIDNEQIIPIRLSDDYQDDIKNFELYGEKFLYPILHSKLPNDNDVFQSERKLWKSYNAINQAVCDFLTSVLTAEDIVIAFDYSFLPLPYLLRKEMNEIGIGTFFRCPFPSSEMFRTLVRAKEIIQGVLGSNVVGFQTFSYAKHFISACTRILGLESNENVIDNNYFPVNVTVNLLGNEVNELQWIM